MTNFVNTLLRDFLISSVKEGVLARFLRESRNLMFRCGVFGNLLTLV